MAVFGRTLSDHENDPDPHPQYSGEATGVSQAEFDAHVADTTAVHGLTAANVIVEGDTRLTNERDPTIHGDLDHSVVYERQTNKGQASGYASLDGQGRLPSAQLTTHAHAIADVTNLQASLDAKAASSVVTDHVELADPHTQYALDTDLSNHAAAADPHTGYQKESEKGQANGYASLDASTLVPFAQLGTGTADGTKFLRDDRTWATPAGGPGGSDPAQGSYAPGTFSIVTGKYAILAKRLELTTTQRVSLAGTARLRIT